MEQQKQAPHHPLDHDLVEQPLGHGRLSHQETKQAGRHQASERMAILTQVLTPHDHVAQLLGHGL